MKLSEFDFDLPAKLIATRPVRPRPAARMLVAGPASIEDRVVADLPGLLRPGDRLVLNDTKVIPARLEAVRIRQSDQGETRARVEITLLSLTPTGSWRALAKPARRLRLGEVLEFGAGLEACVLAKPAGGIELGFNQAGDALDAALQQVGQMPLPPYIANLRPVDKKDNEDYQTVFASVPGAVAAPTASLHFDQPLLEELALRGVDITKVTLHVGAGTFLPVKVEDVRSHRMHAEWGEVSARAADQINTTLAAGGRVIPVGTTALRLIEAAAVEVGNLQPFCGETDIFITPGYRFKIACGLMTNFHLPKSTLMMLVSALMGQARIRDIYRHAIARDYRFFSYGDSSLLIP